MDQMDLLGDWNDPPNESAIKADANGKAWVKTLEAG